MLITPRPVTVTAVTTTKIYDGTTIAAGTPTLDPPLIPGDTATTLWQEFQNSNAGVGNKVIIPSITISDGNGGTNYEVTPVTINTGTITPATATIELADLTPTYDGTPKSATATTSPAGLSVSITYDESPTPPTDAGSYAVLATIADTNYQGTTSGTLVIAPANDFTAWRASHFAETEQLQASPRNPPTRIRWLAESRGVCAGHRSTKLHSAVGGRSRRERPLLIFTRPAGLPDITYVAESTEDFAPGRPSRSNCSFPAATETMHACDPLDTGDPSRRFLRLRIERP